MEPRSMLRTLLVDILMEAAPAAGGAPAEGAPAGGLPAGGGPQPAPGLGDFLRSPLTLMLLVMLVWWVFLIGPQGRKRKNQRAQLLASVKKGDTVRMMSGLIAKVWRVDPNEITVIIDKDREVKARFTKDAVSDIVQREGGAGSDKTEAEGAAAKS